MIRRQVAICCTMLFASAAGMRAQPVPPAPPAPPAPRERAIPVTPAPEPPEPPEPFEFNLPDHFDFGPDFSDRIKDSVNAAMDKANQAIQAANISLQTPFFQRNFYGNSNDDRLYESGQRALDRSQWDTALTNFTQVASHSGPRSDGALYWKAYALNKLGRRDEALAAIADLRKSYPKSRWLDDANALEIEVKQAAGQNVSPDAQPDEELKLLALNALVHSDPDRAVPVLENVLKSSQPPRLKERALFVLVQSGSPRAQQTLDQLARGNMNPDLQLKAIQYLGMASNRQSSGQILSEVYTASNDQEVKRAVINALAIEERNTKTLVDLARKETNPELKRDMVQRLSHMKSKEALDYMMELLK